ncbi:DUF6286 domain-containing protein [Streptomyces sp. NRRL S-920]|uniref:DUF6286 domain-containing protein n=1 Tax=Streptomyces sp. NRRL S-920 TaxID=1463921 RepID=UPI0004C8A751|nr:DUF6286 domain-containing protein [Streptomyces sp. NRRL S-920]
MSEPSGSGATQPLPVVGQARQGEDGSGPASGATPHPLPTLAAEDTGGKASRFWSPRRVPAALLALLIFGGAGLLLYDIVAVRAGHSAMRWRHDLAHQLGERPLDDAAVLAGAAVAALAGLWLLVLAATPGQRALLPMRRTGSDVRAGLYRDAAATMLRDRAMDVSGVQSARVRMTRSKVNVRAVSHFRELDDVRGDLDATLADAIRDLGLARAPELSVHVARPGKKG